MAKESVPEERETVDSFNLLPPMWILALAAFVLVIWLLFALKEIVVLLVVGYSIAFLVDPVLTYLEKHKIRRSNGFFLVCAAAVTVVAVLFLTAYPVLSREFSDLSTNLPRYVDQAKTSLEPVAQKVQDLMQRFGESSAEQLAPDEAKHKAVEKLLSLINGDTVKGVFGGVFSTLLSGYNLVLIVVNLALLPFIVFYLAVDFKALHQNLLMLFPPKRRQQFYRLGGEIHRSVSAFVRGQITVGFILFVLYMIGLKVVGVKLWFILALISGFGNLIPYFGFLTGILLSSVMALVTFGDATHLLQVMAVYAVVQALEGTLITPKIVGDSVGLSPLAVILALFAGGKLFGLLGLFLAIPFAASGRVLWKELHSWLLRKGQLSPADGK